MKQSLGRIRLGIPATIGVFVLSAAYFSYFVLYKKPLVPAPLTVSDCKELKPGMRRITEVYPFQPNGPASGFHFDVPVEDFTIREGMSDAPPFLHGFGIRHRDGASMSIHQIDTESLGRIPIPPALIDSGPVEKQNVLDEQGNIVGEDSWGYLESGELWRRVRLRGRIVVSYGVLREKDVAIYGSVRAQDAERFDRIIGSVCVAPSG